MHVLRRFHLFILLTVFCLSITACGDTQSTGSSPANTSNQPTPIPPATLGSPLSAFDAKFGNRGTTTDDKSGSYTWNTTYGDLDLYVDTLTSVSLSDPTKNLVQGVVFSFPFDASATSTPVLTYKAASKLFTPFLPPDAVHVKDVLSQSSKVVGGAILIKMYVSRQLAKVLPASSFVDHYGSQLQRGLITVLLSLGNDDKNQISEVIVQSGEDLPGGYTP